MKNETPLCHLCKHFHYDDVRSWPNGHCDELRSLVQGNEMVLYRPRPISRKRMCANFDPHGIENDGFPMNFSEYHMAHYEWEEMDDGESDERGDSASLGR